MEASGAEPARRGCLFVVVPWLLGTAGLAVLAAAYGRTSGWGFLLGAWLVGWPLGLVAWDTGAGLGGPWRFVTRAGCGFLALLFALVAGFLIAWVGPPAIAV